MLAAGPEHEQGKGSGQRGSLEARGGHLDMPPWTSQRDEHRAEQDKHKDDRIDLKRKIELAVQERATQRDPIMAVKWRETTMQEWSGDLRDIAAGIGGGKPYQLDGEFVTVDAPYQLSHTWRSVGAPGGPSLVTYGLATHGDGVHLTLRHTGLMNPDICEKTRAGWETDFARLQEITQAEKRRPFHADLWRTRCHSWSQSLDQTWTRSCCTSLPPSPRRSAH